MNIVNELTKRRPDILFTIEEASGMQFLFAHTTYGHHMLGKIPKDINTLCIDDIIEQLDKILKKNDNEKDEWIKTHFKDFIITAVDYDSHNVALCFHPYIRLGDLAFICSLERVPMFRLPFSEFTKQNLNLIYDKILINYRDAVLKNRVADFMITDKIPFRKSDIEKGITLQSEYEIYFILLYQNFWNEIEKITGQDVYIQLPDDHTIILSLNKQNAEYIYKINEKIYKKV